MVCIENLTKRDKIFKVLVLLSQDNVKTRFHSVSFLCRPFIIIVLVSDPHPVTQFINCNPLPSHYYNCDD